MQVSTLARSLGLAETANQDDCLKEIARRRQAVNPAAKQERTVDSKSDQIRAMAACGLSPRQIGEALVSTHDVNEALGLAEEVSPNSFLLEGHRYNAEQLTALMEARGDAEHAAQEDREPSLKGQDLHDRAVALLATRHVFTPNAEQMLLAYEEVGSA